MYDSWGLLLLSRSGLRFNKEYVTLLACFFVALKRGRDNVKNTAGNAIKSLDHLNREVLYISGILYLAQLTPAAPRMLGSYWLSKHL